MDGVAVYDNGGEGDEGAVDEVLEVELVGRLQLWWGRLQAWYRCNIVVDWTSTPLLPSNPGKGGIESASSEKGWIKPGGCCCILPLNSPSPCLRMAWAEAAPWTWRPVDLLPIVLVVDGIRHSQPEQPEDVGQSSRGGGGGGVNSAQVRVGAKQHHAHMLSVGERWHWWWWRWSHAQRQRQWHAQMLCVFEEEEFVRISISGKTLAWSNMVLSSHTGNATSLSLGFLVASQEWFCVSGQMSRWEEEVSPSGLFRCTGSTGPGSDPAQMPDAPRCRWEDVQRCQKVSHNGGRSQSWHRLRL